MLQERHHRGPGERCDRARKHLADVGAGQAAHARVGPLPFLGRRGDGPGLDEGHALETQGPLHVLRRPEQLLRPAGQPHNLGKLRGVEARRGRAVTRRARLAVHDVAVGPDRAGQHRVAAPRVRFDDERGGVPRMAGEDDTGRARLDEALHEDGHRSPTRSAHRPGVTGGPGGGGEAGPRGPHDVFFPAHVEEAAVLPGEAGLARVFQRRRGPHRDRAAQAGKSRAQGRFPHPLERAIAGQEHEAVGDGQARAPQPREGEGLGPHAAAVVRQDLVEPEDLAHHAPAQGRGEGDGAGGAGLGSGSGISAST